MALIFDNGRVTILRLDAYAEYCEFRKGGSWWGWDRAEFEMFSPVYGITIYDDHFAAPILENGVISSRFLFSVKYGINSHWDRIFFAINLNTHFPEIFTAIYPDDESRVKALRPQVSYDHDAEVGRVFDKTNPVIRRALVRYKSYAVELFPDMTEEEMHISFMRFPGGMGLFNYIPEKVQIAVMEKYPSWIGDILHPCEAAQLISLRSDIHLIGRIRNPYDSARVWVKLHE